MLNFRDKARYGNLRRNRKATRTYKYGKGVSLQREYIGTHRARFCKRERIEECRSLERKGEGGIRAIEIAPR